MARIENSLLEQIRGIDLERVFEAYGATRNARDKSNWDHATGRYSTKGDLFYNHSPSSQDAEGGGRGAIDLAMRLGEQSFSEATNYLSKHIGIDIKSDNKPIGKPIALKPEKTKTEIPPATPEKLRQVRAYLIKTRAIPSPVVEKAIQAGRLWADSFGNAVFALKDPAMTGATVGAELRGTYESKPFHGVRGEKKGVFITGSADEKTAIFTESSIESLSMQAIDPNMLAIGCIGGSRETTAQAAKILKSRGFKILAGFNQDKDGDRYTKNLHEDIGIDARLRPGEYKDWNLFLKNGRTAKDIVTEAPPKAAQEKAEKPVTNKKKVEEYER